MPFQEKNNTDQKVATELAKEIQEARAPVSGYSLWFLGQNSFILTSGQGITVAIDPYLSDWCAQRGSSGGPTPKSRLFPPPMAPEDLDVDLVLLTHSHCDHADPETLASLAKKPGLLVAGPHDALLVASKAGIPAQRLKTLHAGEEVCFTKKGGVMNRKPSPSTSATEVPSESLTVKATFALSTDGTDLNHVGFLLCFPGGTSFWDTGDSAWCDYLPQLAGKEAFKAAAAWRKRFSKRDDTLPDYGPDLMAVCINAGYGNLSHWDASRLAGAAEARYVIPTHWDLFPHNSLNPEPFRTSLEKNAPTATYICMERDRRYDYVQGEFFNI